MKAIFAAAAVAALVASQAAVAQRSGKEVVESTCASCHAKGAQGAPRIGDRKAWSARSAQGLRSLTQSAIKGIRNMPAHGGDTRLSDLEIARAIAHMVNRSGGKWTEPASLQQLAAERSGPQVYREQCVKCHEKGVGGAPKIGELPAWTPRLKDGLDNMVRSAIRGHGGMPPRGDRADLTDGEVRNAVLYMVNPGASGKAEKEAPRSAAPSTLYRSVGGMDVHLGLVSAETMRVFPEGSVERSMHGGVPSGRGYYHVNVSLVDAKTKAPVGDAKVDIRLEQPGVSSVSKTLEPVTINNAPSYGNYVRMPGGAYRITLQVRRPGAAAPVEARFEHRTR